MQGLCLAMLEAAGGVVFLGRQWELSNNCANARPIPNSLNQCFAHWQVNPFCLQLVPHGRLFSFRGALQRLMRH